MITLTQELIRLQEQDYEESLRQRIERAMSRICCPECGAADGMIALYPEHVIAYLDELHRYPWPERGMYRLQGVDDRLYTPCDLCCSEVDGAYEQMQSRAHVRVWAQQFRDCEVYLPDEYPWDPNLGGYFHPNRPGQLVVEPGEMERW
jgi:hypothetical protein